MSSQPPDDPDHQDDEPTYEVGYGKPPKATRFQPGKSGNPKGRPKGSRKVSAVDLAVEQLKALALKEAYRPIKIKDGDTLVEMPTIQAALRNVALSAAKGDQRAQRMLFDTVVEVEGERRRDRLKLFEAAVACKQRGEAQIASARAYQMPVPDLMPHPDQFIIDPIVGSATLRGPLTSEEKVEWDQYIAMKADFRNQLTELEVARRAAPRRRSLKKRIESFRSVINKIDAYLNSFERILVPGQY